MATSHVLVYGGRGALGSAIIKHFKSKNIWVASVDLFANEEADANVLLTADTLLGQQGEVSAGLQSSLGEHQLQAIFCVAGGWAGGNAASEDFLKNAEMMMKQSVWSSLIASQVAASHMAPGGVLVLTGAQPAISGTPGMIGYGMAKAAVHQLVASLAGDDSGLPTDSIVAAILPVTLDTPMNRKFMPDADQTKWTPLEFVAGLFYDWFEKKSRPTNGSLMQLFTADGKTELKAV